MPRVWTTKENTEFLESEFDGFLTSQRKSRVQLFMAGVFDRWFQRFPIEDEPLRDANDNPLPMTEGQRAETLAPDLRKQFLNEAKTKKMAQVRRWFNWAASKRKRATAPAAVSIFQGAKPGKGQRAPQKVEVYQHLYPKKVRDAMEDARLKGLQAKTRASKVAREAAKQAWKFTGAEEREVQFVTATSQGIRIISLTASERLTIQRDVAQHMLKMENDLVKREVDDEMKKWKLEKDKSADQDTVVERSALDYHKALSTFPAALTAAMQNAADATGWIICVVAAGPNPSAKGEIYMDEFYFGPTTTTAGNNFMAAHVDFDSHVRKPFAKHARNCYSTSERQRRALYLKSEDEAILSTSSKDSSRNPSPSLSLSALPECDEIDSTTLLDPTERSQLIGVDTPITPHVPAVTHTTRSQSKRRVIVDDSVDQPISTTGFEFLNDGTVFEDDFPYDPELYGLPPNRAPPDVPGGPTSPLANAINRMAAYGNNNSFVPTPSDNDIDPQLLGPPNPSGSSLISLCNNLLDSTTHITTPTFVSNGPNSINRDINSRTQLPPGTDGNAPIDYQVLGAVIGAALATVPVPPAPVRARARARARPRPVKPRTAVEKTAAPSTTSLIKPQGRKRKAQEPPSEATNSSLAIRRSRRTVTAPCPRDASPDTLCRARH